MRCQQTLENKKFVDSNVLPSYLKQIFSSISWFFTEVEGDRIEFRIPFKIFSTLNEQRKKIFRNIIYLASNSPWIQSNITQAAYATKNPYSS